MIKFVYTNPFFKRYKYIFTSLKALNFSKIKSLQKEIIEKKNVEKKGVENKGIEQISALKYFTKLEIFYLFFIPFAFVSTYIFFMWNVFKYICGVKDINHFFKLIRWLNGKDSYPFDHLHNKKIEKKVHTYEHIFHDLFISFLSNCKNWPHIIETFNFLSYIPSYYVFFPALDFLVNSHYIQIITILNNTCSFIF